MQPRHETPQIRRAQAGDAARLTEIALQSKAHWRYPAAQLEAWREQLRMTPQSIASCPTFVAELGGEMVGFISLLPAAPHWQLDHLWVLPSHMGAGAGSRLLAHALGYAAENGQSTLSIDADPNAEAFYQSRGARRVGAVPAPIEGDAQRVRPQMLLATMPPEAGPAAR